MGHQRCAWGGRTAHESPGDGTAVLPAPVQGFFAAHGQRDPARLDALLADGVVAHDGGRDLRGRQAVRQAMADLLAAFPDYDCTVLDGVREGDRVAVRWDMSGTHTGPYLGRPPTGRVVRATGLTLFRLDPSHSRILETWSHGDLAAALARPAP